MGAPNPLFLREEELEHGLELLYRVGRRLNLDALALRADSEIDEIDHHALFLVDRRPGITQAELCAALGLSKQTMSRRLRRLVEAGCLEIGGPSADRRKRPLRLTAQAATLLAAIKAQQKRRLRLAFKSAGADAVEGFERVLLELVGEPRRDLLRRWAGVTGVP